VKKIVLATVLAAAATATPALAQDAVVAGEFTGPRVGVELGLIDDDFLGSDETSYGVLAGYDFDAGNVIVGGAVSYTGLFDDDGADFRDITVSGRVGAKLAPRTLAYASAGYSNLDFDGLPGSVDGVKFGLGLEQSFGNVYANVETRYGNYEAGLELYQTVIGVGFRF
jgi:outer membrane immunogenic protein